jgi:hypothetical protein
VSISDEHDLTGRLDQAFQAITPRPAPVDQAVRRGRGMRIRRRVVAVAAPMAAAAAIAVPVALNLQSAPQPTLIGPRHHSVTVHAPGPHAPAGLIASGTADGKRWSVTVKKAGPDTPPGTRCITAVGLNDCSTVTAASRSDPVVFAGSSSGSTDASYGPVTAAVSYVTVRLADGTVLTLHPVEAYGPRYVAFAVPLHMAITRVTAYSAHGELATAVPFNDPSGGATVGAWLRPGQTGLRRATGVISSAGAGTGAWSVTAYVGPWGDCLATRANGGSTSTCNPVSSPQGTRILGTTSGPPELMYGSTAADVEHLVISPPGGGTIRVPVIQVGDQKFFAFSMSHDQGQHAVRWQAFDAARHLVGAGHFGGP